MKLPKLPKVLPQLQHPQYKLPPKQPQAKFQMWSFQSRRHRPNSRRRLKSLPRRLNNRRRSVPRRHNRCSSNRGRKHRQQHNRHNNNSLFRRALEEGDLSPRQAQQLAVPDLVGRGDCDRVVLVRVLWVLVVL